MTKQYCLSDTCPLYPCGKSGQATKDSEIGGVKDKGFFATVWMYTVCPSEFKKLECGLVSY